MVIFAGSVKLTPIISPENWLKHEFIVIATMTPVQAIYRMLVGTVDRELTCVAATLYFASLRRGCVDGMASWRKSDAVLYRLPT
ncbi:hypothetical protein EMCRGX_G034466 [Ephydatia muelleri]